MTERVNLYDLTIDVNDEIDGHIEITLTAQTYHWAEPDTAADYPDVTVPEFVRICQHAANVLARVAIWAVPWIEEERRKHGCDVPRMRPADEGSDPREVELSHPSMLYDCCEVSAWELLQPSRVARGDSPWICLTVPPTRVDAWLARITLWLDALAVEMALADRIEDEQTATTAAKVDAQPLPALVTEPAPSDTPASQVEQR